MTTINVKFDIQLMFIKMTFENKNRIINELNYFLTRRIFIYKKKKNDLKTRFKNEQIIRIQNKLIENYVLYS